MDTKFIVTHGWWAKKKLTTLFKSKEIIEEGAEDIYGAVKHIFELTYIYTKQDNKVVLFYCE
jgi:hypothetical protein